MRAPDAFAFLTPEEADLVRERFPGAPPGEVVGIGVETDQPTVTPTGSAAGTGWATRRTCSTSAGSTPRRARPS